MGAERTPEERERLYELMWETDYPGGLPWVEVTSNRSAYMAMCDRRLTAFPQLWDSLPPDPAETARKEAEEDGATVERSRIAREMWIRGGYQRDEYPLDVGDLLDVIDRMTARAAAGYPVLIAPKGEK